MEKDRKHLSLLAIYERSLIRILKILAPLIYASCYPVFFLSSCEKNSSASKNITTPVSISSFSFISPSSPESKSLDWKLINRLDVFVFDSGDDGELDFYQRLDGCPSGGLSVISSGGSKRLAALANCDFSEENIAGIWNFRDFRSLEMSLREDSPEYPMMSGDTIFVAGNATKLELEPMMSRLYVNIDNNENGMEDISIYLTGVNSRADVLEKSRFEPSDIINSGRLREDDLKTMKYPRMVCNHLSGLSSGVLYCYPNCVIEESSGMSATRLVIEGKVDSITRYYPIKLDISRRNFNYNINVNLSSSGTSDPEENLRTFEGTASAKILPAQYLEGAIGDTLHIYVETVPDWAEVDFDDELLDDDRSRGIYDYTLGEDRKSIDLYLQGSGMGALLANVGAPVNDSYAIIIICKGKTQ